MSMIGNIGGQSGGGILTKSVLIVTAPTGSAVSVTNGPVTKTAAEKNGEWWFRNLDNGNWTITATKNTQKATASYSITQFGVYRKSITYFQATIHVTYPAGSTCTAADGATTLRAPDTSGSWACVVPNAGNWTITSTLGGQSDKKVVSISSDGQTASVVLAYRITPEFTYTGSYQVVQDNDSPISDFANWKGTWKIRFLTSGTLTFSNLHGFSGKIDLFLVGGGGGASRAGAGGGYTTNKKSILVSTNIGYDIFIGSGGSAGVGNERTGGKGGSTSAFGAAADGGDTPVSAGISAGATGGSGGGAASASKQPGSGGSDGQNGGNSENGDSGGAGHGVTTREFGEPTWKLYAGGGAGGSINTSNRLASGGDGGGGDGGNLSRTGAEGATNTGGGGGGAGNGVAAGAGGSGIAIIRNAR